ncbi:MAG: hypothetical protein H7256_02755 [Bdellovibrio sp.]|nr:hypothetical protein [Bdellovibrio sp.]
MKYKVSISTLRRRIKTEDIQYKFDDGKYLILDEPVAASPNYVQEHRPSLKSDVSESGVPRMSSLEANKESGESVITAANRLLADLKKAYTQILQEKELQIQRLNSEISDLNTLIKVLESENHRLRN